MKTLKMKQLAVCAVMSGCLLAGVASVGWAGSKGPWVHPNFTASDWNELFDPKNEKKWAEVLENAEVFQFFIDQVRDLNASNTREKEMKKQIEDAVQLFRKYRIDIAIEGGGTMNWAGCDDQNGERSADFEIRKIQPIYDAGGVVKFFAMDDPISRVIQDGRAEGNCGFTLERSIAELIDYMRTMHAAHPEIKLGLIVNFPNWSYRGEPSYWGEGKGWAHLDYADVLDRVVREVRAAGEEIHFLHADQPYRYTLGTAHSTFYKEAGRYDWLRRLQALRGQARDLKLDFGVILNTEITSDPRNEPREPQCDRDFYEDTLAYERLLNGSRIGADNLIVESWYSLPSRLLPENESFTFMNLARQLIRQMDR